MKQASRRGALRPPQNAGPSPVGAPEWRHGLRDAITSRVLPRLAPRGDGESARDDAAARLAALALAGPSGRLADEIEALRAGEASFEAVMLDVVAPAARRLGELWLADRIGFFDVTAAVGRLQALARALEPTVEGDAARGEGRRILLAPVPGEHHVFGLSMVAAFFRRAGWDVTFEPRIAPDALREMVAAEPFAAIGLSASGDRALADLPDHVASLRRASRDRGIVVLVGGPAFADDAGLCGRVGADAAPPDAAAAVRTADRLLARVEAA